MNTLTQQRSRKLTIAHQLNAFDSTFLAIQMRNEPSSTQQTLFIDHFEKFMKVAAFKQVNMFLQKQNVFRKIYQLVFWN